MCARRTTYILLAHNFKNHLNIKEMDYKGYIIKEEPQIIYDFDNTLMLFSGSAYDFPAGPDEWIEKFQNAKMLGKNVSIDVDIEKNNYEDDYSEPIINIKAIPYRYETKEELIERIQIEKNAIDALIRAKEQKARAKEQEAAEKEKKENNKQKSILDEAIRICEENGYRVKPKKKSR